MKVCFFSPYLPDSSVGGGEKHLFDIALVAARKYQVYIAIKASSFADEAKIREKYEKFLGADLSHLNFVSTPLFDTQANFFQKLSWTKQFDYLFYWSDGSVFFSMAKINNLHLQIPFTDKKTLIDQLKLKTWQLKNANSEFTRKVIEKSWNTRVDFVHYPLVDTQELRTNQKKEKIILSVGRFFRQLHSKRQDVIVETFEKFVENYPKESSGYKLVLIGFVEDKDYFQEIKQKAMGLPVEFYHDLSRSDLINWYKKAKFYWHATGFGVDESEHPEKVEHFGITSIEAMAAGALPVLINKGGQREILQPDLEDLLWDKRSQAAQITARLISDEEYYESCRQKIAVLLQKFNRPAFEQRVWEMLETVV